MKYLIVEPLRKNKKYSVIVYKYGRWHYLLSFGQLRNANGDYYEHYKDVTPLQLYSDLNHNDKNRRRLYYARHGKTNNKNSATYWSNKYLWPLN